MAEYTEADAVEAEAITSNLFGRDGRGMDVREGVSIADVQANARIFEDEYVFLQRIGEPFLAARFGDRKPVPISLSAVHSDLEHARYRRRFIGPDFRRYSYDIARYGFAGAEVVELSPDEAHVSFLSAARDFLANRILAARTRRDRAVDADDRHLQMLTVPQTIDGGLTQVPGCDFKVSCNTGNLSVYWSGAYFISPNYFGHPTSPTFAPLQSGTYVFGVRGGAHGSGVQWDTNAVCTLPGKPDVHLQL